jgi:hypothetical protein
MVGVNFKSQKKGVNMPLEDILDELRADELEADERIDLASKVLREVLRTQEEGSRWN